MDGGYSHLILPDGSVQMLPYHLRPGGVGRMVAPCNLVSPAGELTYRVAGVTVEGWPKPDRSFQPNPELGISGFVFNGQTVTSEGRGFLATLYGNFEDDKRYSLVLVESADGHAWQVRSIIAGPDCALDGEEGPCESAICRLADGRIMCVFRLASFKPYGQCWSSDEGETWTEPMAMAAHSVEPSLQVLGDGTVALSGGRNGIYVWLNRDGKGEAWQPIDVVAHHNACQPETDHINSDSTLAWRSREDMIQQGVGGFSSCYTELARLNDNTLLLIYDRVGLGWHAIPDESDESNSVWVLRLTVKG